MWDNNQIGIIAGSKKHEVQPLMSDVDIQL